MKSFNDTNLFPMFAECVHEGKFFLVWGKRLILKTLGFDGARLCDYLKSIGVLAFPGGMPSSMVASGQQWDFPNAWAPTTWVAIQVGGA